MTGEEYCVIMVNTMDTWLSILIMIVGAVAGAAIAFFFGKIGKKNNPDDEGTN
jgi:membrane protein DedA with SNARE-associated domain